MVCEGRCVEGEGLVRGGMLRGWNRELVKGQEW